MAGMDAARETSPATPASPAPPPGSGGGRRTPPASSRLSPETVLRWVAEAGGPWYPAAHAARTDTPRDDLDAPLAELRDAGLVRVAAWQKGLGQGYLATPEGEQVVGRTPPPPAPVDEPISAELVGVLDLRPPLITPALIAANLLWFAFAVAVALRWGFAPGTAFGGGSVVVLERVGALSAADLLRGEWWRLLTAAFVHIGFWHLALNMIGLGMTGSAAELLWGRWRTVVIYVAAALAGSCVAMANRPVVPGADVPVLLGGASGAVWGLMGSVFAWFVLFRHDLPEDVADDLGRRLGIAFLLNAGVSFIPGVSWECHLGGGVAGFVAAGLLNAARFSGPLKRVAVAALVGLIPVVSVGVLLLAMDDGDAWAPLRAKAAPAPTPDELAALLNAISPDAAKPARVAAARVWAVSAGRRAAQQDIARAALDALRATTLEATRAAATRPAEPAWVRARAAAEARLRELDDLRQLIDAAEPPTAAAWATWGDRRRAADLFWAPPEQPRVEAAP